MVNKDLQESTDLALEALVLVAENHSAVLKLHQAAMKELATKLDIAAEVIILLERRLAAVESGEEAPPPTPKPVLQ